MFKVTAARFHTAIQTFSRLINSVVDNGLLHTGPRINQTHVRLAYDIQISKLVN